MDNLKQLKINDIIKYLLREKISFWLLLVYILFEYLRPQSMYPVLDIIPWGKVIIIAIAAAFFLEGNRLRVKNIENVLIILYFLVIIASSLTAISPEQSWGSSSVIVLYVGIYFLIINSVNTENRLYLFIILFLLINFKLASFVGMNWVKRGFEYDKYGAVAGLGWLENPGEFGIEMVIFFSIIVNAINKLTIINISVMLLPY